MTSTMERLTTESIQLGKSEVPFSVVLEEGIQDRWLSGKAKFTIVNTLGCLWCHKREGKFIFVYFFKCLLLRQKERVCVHMNGGGAQKMRERERERERIPSRFSSALSAQSPTWGSILQAVRS